jgi:hypothetical protein
METSYTILSSVAEHKCVLYYSIQYCYRIRYTKVGVFSSRSFLFEGVTHGCSGHHVLGRGVSELHPLEQKVRQALE